MAFRGAFCRWRWDPLLSLLFFLTQALQYRSTYSKGAGLGKLGDTFSTCLHFRIENPMPGLNQGLDLESHSVLGCCLGKF